MLASNPAMSFPFRELPPEIRQMVYEELFSDSYIEIRNTNQCAEWLREAPPWEGVRSEQRCRQKVDLAHHQQAITLVSRQTRTESLPIFDRVNTIVMRDVVAQWGGEIFLQMNSPDLLRRYRNLRFVTNFLVAPLVGQWEDVYKMLTRFFESVDTFQFEVDYHDRYWGDVANLLWLMQESRTEHEQLEPMSSDGRADARALAQRILSHNDLLEHVKPHLREQSDCIRKSFPNASVYCSLVSPFPVRPQGNDEDMEERNYGSVIYNGIRWKSSQVRWKEACGLISGICFEKPTRKNEYGEAEYD